MKKSIPKITVNLLAIIAFISLCSQKGIELKPVGTWVAPAEADTLINPLKENMAATDEGKVTFKRMCVVCHGDKGKGDGIAGVNLTPHPANFIEDKVINQSDGAIFWKLTTGRAPMASYKNSLTDEKRWQLVNYIRQLERDANQIKINN